MQQAGLVKFRHKRCCFLPQSCSLTLFRATYQALEARPAKSTDYLALFVRDPLLAEDCEL